MGNSQSWPYFLEESREQLIKCTYCVRVRWIGPTLTQPGDARSGLFIAATGNDAVNLASCQLAKQVFNVPSTVAVALEPENATLFEALGGQNVSPRTGEGLAPGDVAYLVFPFSFRNRSSRWPASNEQISEQVRGLLDTIGGIAVLKACISGR